MSFPPGTEMFQFPGFASTTYVFSCRYPIGVGCPIRISTDQRLLAAPRGFSQRATSFIASWCQGIHRMPFSCSRLPQPFEGRTRTHHAQEPSTHTLALTRSFICKNPRSQQASNSAIHTFCGTLAASSTALVTTHASERSCHTRQAARAITPRLPVRLDDLIPHDCGVEGTAHP